MSTEQVQTQPSEIKEHVSETIELAKQEVDINKRLYHLDVNQNGDSIFIRIIEDPASQRRTRVVIPMCVCSEVRKRLQQMVEFCDQYEPKNVSEKKSRTDKTIYAHSISYNSPGGRVYYLDLIDADDILTLRLSYLFSRRRDTVQVLAEAIPTLIGIILQFESQFPSISPTDDYPAPKNLRPRMRRNFNDRKFGGQRNNNQEYSSGETGRPFRPRQPHQYNGTGPIHDGSDSRRSNALKVVTNPPPGQVGSNLKKYTVEIVEGVNTFFRITEMIGENRKSTLHIPIEICGELHRVISDMNKEYHQLKKAVAPVSSTIQKS